MMQNPQGGVDSGGGMQAMLAFSSD